MRLHSLIPGLFCLAHYVEAQNGSCAGDQPSLSAPYTNPWKSLTEEDSVSINELLQRRFNLTGNEGSR